MQSQEIDTRTQRNTTTLCLTSQYGVFQSEMQKQSRLEKFWLVEIDNYYRKQVKDKELQMLDDISQEAIPSLNEVINNTSKQSSLRVPFEELFRYVELVRQCRGSGELLLVQNEGNHYLAVLQGGRELSKLVEISAEEAILITERLKFMNELQRRQCNYNTAHNTNEKLSQLTSQMAFLLYHMRDNKKRIDSSIERIKQRISESTNQQAAYYDQARDNYVKCLIRKNMRKALLNTEIDYLNYFANMDEIQLHGIVDKEKPIADKKEFEEFISRKKSKKSRKNNKGILKTACAACLSPHYEQYNPLLYCPDCQIRYHKYCYTPFKDGLCQTCFCKKQPIPRGRNTQCQLCGVKGLLTFPFKFPKDSIAIHIFCMLINRLWKFQNGALQFKSSTVINPNVHNDTCIICNSAVYTYPCRNCQVKAHPLCAYMSGWNLQLSEEDGVWMECSCSGVRVEQQSYRRKFMLNFKKMLYKSDRER